MTPIGATSANTIPGETPVLPQETITSDPNDGFSKLLSQGKGCDSIPLQPAAAVGKDEKAAISKKSAAEGDSLADNTGNISYLAACMVVIQPLHAPSASGSPVVSDSASEAEPGTNASEKGSVKGADFNGATVANAPIEEAAFDSLGLTIPVSSAAIAKDGATRDLEGDTATGSEVSIKTSAVGITEGTEAAPDRAIAGKDVAKYSEVNATAQGKSPVDTIPLNSAAVTKTRLELNTVDIGTVEGVGANTAMKRQGTGEEVLPDTGITIPGPSGNLEMPETADGIETATAMVVNALVGKATSTKAMESALNANTTERWKANSVEGQGTIAEQQTKSVMNNADGEPSEKASNTFATLNTPNVIEVLNSANLSEAVALNGENGPKKTSENAVSDAVSMIFQNGLLSEKIAESAAANSPFSVKNPSDKAATMAGLSDIDGQDANAATAKEAQLSISNSIQTASGMPVATHRESMPPVHAQSETKMPLSEKSDTLIVPPNASSGKVDTAKLVAADSPERKFDNGEDTTSNGANFLAPSLSATVRNVDSSSKFQMESTTKNAFHQDIPSICDHTFEAIGRMHSDGKDGVEVRLRLHDGQELTIQLRMNSGEVQPVFKTDSTDLRIALEQNWNQFSAHSADRGIRVAAPVFESGQMGTGDSQQQRQDQHFQHHPVILEDEVFQQPVAAGTRGTTSLGVDEGTSSEPTVLSLFA